MVKLTPEAKTHISNNRKKLNPELKDDLWKNFGIDISTEGIRKFKKTLPSQKVVSKVVEPTKKVVTRVPIVSTPGYPDRTSNNRTYRTSKKVLSPVVFEKWLMNKAKKSGNNSYTIGMIKFRGSDLKSIYGIIQLAKAEGII